MVVVVVVEVVAEVEVEAMVVCSRADGAAE